MVWIKLPLVITVKTLVFGNFTVLIKNLNPIKKTYNA